MRPNKRRTMARHRRGPGTGQQNLLAFHLKICQKMRFASCMVDSSTDASFSRCFNDPFAMTKAGSKSWSVMASESPPAAISAVFGECKPSDAFVWQRVDPRPLVHAGGDLSSCRRSRAPNHRAGDVSQRCRASRSCARCAQRHQLTWFLPLIGRCHKIFAFRASPSKHRFLGVQSFHLFFDLTRQLEGFFTHALHCATL